MTTPLQKTTQEILDSKESMLKEAVANALVALRNGSGTAKAYEEAEAALDRYLEKNNPTEASETKPAAGEWFKNETEAYNFLMGLGYEISRGKFNQDKNAGQFVQDGRRISKFSVLQYGLRLKREVQTINGAVSAELLARRDQAETEKSEHDARISKTKADDAERELDKRWLYRDVAVSDLAAIIASLQQSLDHAAVAGAEAIIASAAGDVARSYDVTTAINELVIARAFNEVVAAGTLRVKFKGEADSDA